MKEATLDLLDHQESRVFPALEAKKVPRETQALREQPAKMVHLV